MKKFEDKKLSIVVPIYNTKSYFLECYKSIANQTYENYELILVDDGSTDGVSKLCDEVALEDIRVRVIHTAHKGPNSARLIGAMNASGEYVTFVDSDDWIDVSMYNELMDICVETNADIVMSGICRYISQEEIYEEKSIFSDGFYNEEKIIKEIIPVMLWSPRKNAWEVDPHLGTKIFKKKLVLEQLQNVKKLNIHYGDDTAVFYPMMLKTKSVYINNRCFYYHRQRIGNAVPPYIEDKDFFDKTYTVYQYLRNEFLKTPYSAIMQKQLDYFLMNSFQLKKRCYILAKNEPEVIFPYYLFEKNTKVILYGAGKIGKLYMQQNKEYEFCNIVMWVDKNYELLQERGINVLAPSEVMKIDYDYLLIAVQQFELALEIKEELIGIGVSEDCIKWKNS